MRNRLFAALAALGAAGGVLLAPGEASADPSIMAATTKAFKNNAQGQCVGPRFFNISRYANLYGCNPADSTFEQQWIFDDASLWSTQIRLKDTSACLQHNSTSSFHVLLAPCNPNSNNQRWNHHGYDGTKFMLKNNATNECMEGWTNEWVEMVGCDASLNRQWWTHLTP